MAASDQASRDNSEVLKTGLISQQLMLIKALVGRPGHWWESAIMFASEGFTMSLVENKLCASFGTKSTDIAALRKGLYVDDVEAALTKPRAMSLGKRPAPVPGDPFRHQPCNVSMRKCFNLLVCSTTWAALGHT
ncbi:hypothetical protein V7S43_009118 [Phytophthora oleae]|uniref:Uncharacterized protein n=1 Tax=Phytophthora oleae TaxID=2107226 RepID=A0ABD3FFH3_9STRA